MFLTVFFVACNGGGTKNSNTKPGEVLESEKQRITDPQVPAADLQALSAGNTAFAFDLYQQLKVEEGNLFYSPLSISIALAMTYAGAQGETESEMADVLHFTLPEADLHAAFNALDLALESRGQNAQGADGQPFRLRVVNALWGQTGYPFLTAFLDVLALNYGAGMTLLDFSTEPEPSRIMINDWVADQTEDRIEDLIPQGAINPMTRLVLTNAVYFNASWLYPFEEENTTQGEFQTPNGPVEVDVMHQTEYFAYAEAAGCQAVELPYDGEELSMVILLPEPDTFDTFEAGLDGSTVSQIVAALHTERVSLSMPKYTFTSHFSLRDVLQAMGMNAPFSGGADFSDMAETNELYIADVIHKAFVGVDEAGTEAAAATAVIMEGTAVQPDPIPVDLTRPFVFFIRDIETGAMVFVGRVTDPSG
jgi:serpin B